MELLSASAFRLGVLNKLSSLSLALLDWGKFSFSWEVVDITRGEVFAVPFCVGVMPAASAVLLTLVDPGRRAGLLELPPIS